MGSADGLPTPRQAELSGHADKTLAHPIDFEKSSARYPLHAVIRIDKSVLSTWNSEVYWPAMAVAIALGVLFGVRAADRDRGGANTIKIDKFFVDTITMDASTTTIVEMLVALARDFHMTCLLYTSPSPRDISGSRMPSSA